MQAVPSLVGTGTAAAAAAVGLVFGQPSEPDLPWASPIQPIFPPDYDGFRAQPVPPRPSTSAVPNYHPNPSPVEDFPYASFQDITEIPAPLDDGGTAQDQPTLDEKREGSQPASEQTPSTDSTPDNRARRSMSMHLSSASQWITRTGSVRRPRRSTIDAKGVGGRLSSDPVAVPRDQAYPLAKSSREGVYPPPDGQQQPQQSADSEPIPADLPRTRKRNSSSPLPPSNGLSTFNIDVTRVGLATSSMAVPPKAFHAPVNYSQASSTTTHSRGPSGERSVTLAGSDIEIRDGIFGDEEDTDFKSDGMYDSFRTGASSARVRSVETPLESMFDDSPPSTAGNSRTKRLSIQEMLGRSWDGDTKITEEDEGVPTPIRSVHLAEVAELVPSTQEENGFGFHSPQKLALVNPDFDRLSFDDDDDDDDWARDDEDTLSNHLSPPSSTNSRRVSPTLRHALKNISGNAGPGPQRESQGDRPRSNIFDWSEPLAHDRYDADLPRPKTVHGKQELDLRGGRSIIRKPPCAAHVRSQSVPVVPDPADGSKPTPKFGTWGLGTKTASEDWDDDFEFEGDEAFVCQAGGKDSATSFSMVVPASIQATQPSVRAHSGQIRELSLLVNDLKRLCRHGKDLDILKGPMAAKWAEAESIIALASPDEDEPEEVASTKPSQDFDRSLIDDRFLEEGFDGPLLDQADIPLGIPEPEMSRTAVVRERHSPRRRSVFSPEDDIFGNWPLVEGSATPARPRTPSRCSSPSRNSAIISTVIEAMKQQHKTASDRVRGPPAKTPEAKLFFDTNSLHELVKRAGKLRDSLSDAVRRAELLIQSPAGTPRRERHARHQNPDGSPAFTRVFVDPGSSPPRLLANSHSTPSILSRASVESSRMQMMTVS
ncbi:fc20159e-c078-454d-93cb-41657aa462da [Thermothielavioides terrestris]|uniref:Fc20159e-c078-454d-93cb-41657aa462da n=1 Tax=Thermothielavioides terrestris TaxID=2587410 RepID=A0A446BWN0_9PEZI|nr:fc20159e-c078-454d-93cb-41657aa462da [Thermothielavioides terrestris]